MFSPDPPRALSADELQFFHRLSEAIFSNPFDVNRGRVNELLGNRRPVPRVHEFTQLAPVLEKRLSDLETRGIRRLSDVPAAQAEVLRHAFLFQIYQQFIPAFDRLILAQSSRPTTAPDVDFADELIGMLDARGFQRKVSTHYLGFFYQLRRAYYFIVDALVGAAPCMHRLRESLWDNVFTHDVRLYEQFLWPRMEDFSTLLLGETGTGKGSAAAAIGRSGFIPFDTARRRFSASFAETFIAANLSQFPEGLIESALFGHRKGAFTGAIEDHLGLLERCSEHGALFLDEIGDAGCDVQIKLLEVLQNRSFTRVGGYEQRRFRGRVIAATNRSIDRLRAEGKFRDDFFYRLCSDIIAVPTLRQRVEEAPAELELLVDSLVTRIIGERNETLVDRVLTSLRSDLPVGYTWPGNVRELEQAVRRIFLSRRYLGDPGMSFTAKEATIRHGLEAGDWSARELLATYCGLLYDRLGTYEDVAKRTELDRRTVKKYVLQAGRTERR